MQMENPMLTLDLPVEPYWLDLPRGVRVEIRPVTTAVMAAAQAEASRRLGAMRTATASGTTCCSSPPTGACPMRPRCARSRRCRAWRTRPDRVRWTSYVMVVVTPPERTAAASFTTVPRSMVAAAGPAIAGAIFAAGWQAMPFIICGVLKIACHIVLLCPRHVPD
jgi:hypothetical protein